MIFGAAALSVGAVLAGQDGERGGRAWLGVSVEEETEYPDGGARVNWVIDESPAARIGLQKGDIIVSLDGRRVYGPGGLTEAIRSNEPGRNVEVEIIRDGQNQALSVELGERSQSWSVRLRGEAEDRGQHPPVEIAQRVGHAAYVAEHRQADVHKKAQNE